MDCLKESGFTIFYTVCFVENNAIPPATSDCYRGGEDPLIIHDGWGVLEMSRDVLPGLHHCEGTEDKSGFSGIVVHGGDCLDGFPESHVVALEAASDLDRVCGGYMDRGACCFLDHHPANACFLVRKIG